MKAALPEQVKKPHDAITFWTIYNRPKDAPHAFVLRPTYVIRGGVMTDYNNSWYADDPDKLRGILPFGATFVGRDTFDDPAILETWME